MNAEALTWESLQVCGAGNGFPLYLQLSPWLRIEWKVSNLFDET